jgi:nitroimidazol reductase NimA-like FMN-containing flavoprotein (pyridoxamine 5'-phosphate oxidase superfamily)
MILDEGLELLDEDEAMALLQTADVGRVGINVGVVPAIFPVAFRLIDGDIVFRTSPGSKLDAATRGAVVAFEVDEHDRVTRTGWSVLVVGRAEVVHDLDLTFKTLDSGLEPYAAPEDRTAIVRITPSFVSGRRIGGDTDD